MAHIEQDSELFTNVVSAKAIPSGTAFTAFRDQNGTPGVFSLGNDGVLNLFLQTEGRLVNSNFGLACGFSEKVTAFAVRQQGDSSLFVVLSINKGKGDEVVVLPSLSVVGLATPPKSAIIASDINLPHIHGIYLSDYTNDLITGSTYPDVILSFQPPGEITNEADCGLLAFSKPKDGPPKINISKNWSLPTNAERILDLAFGQSVVGKGVFVLYEVQGKRRIVYSTYDGSDFNVLPMCPSDASCLASYTNGAGGQFSGYSSLLVGSAKITHYSPSQYTRKDREGTSISNDLTLSGLKDLHVAQNNASLTMWFTNSEDAAGYYHVHSDSDITNGQMVNLLPAGKGGRLSGLISQTNTAVAIQYINIIVSVDEDSNLISLQQSATNGAWDAYPLTMDTKVENFDVPSYTTRIRVMSNENTAAINGKFILASTGRVSSIVNGKDSILQEGGVTVQTDAAGEATFIVATADISSHTFTISGFEDASGDTLNIPSTEVDPSSKANDKLQTIRNGDDLRKAKTQTGENLIDTKILDPDDIDHAGPLIGQISSHANVLKARKRIQGHLYPERASATASAQQGVSSDLWECWNWVKEHVHDAEEWFVNEVEDGLEFVVKLAGKVWNFLLNTVDSIGKALSWIFTKLKVALNRLIDYLGFLFDWDDILDAKDTFSAFITAGIHWSADKIDSVIPDVDSFFQKILDGLGKKPTELDVEPVDQGPPDAQKRQKSIGFNWSKYHLIHSGGAASFHNEKAPSNPGPIQDLWNDVIDPTIAGIQADVQTLAEQGVQLFSRSDSSVSIQQGLALVGKDLAITFVDAIKNIVEGAMKLLRDLLDWFATVGNQVIPIPIFSALYHDITHHDLTLFDVVCLVIAVPATITAKAITGKALPKLSKTISPSLIQAYIDGTGTKEQLSDINTVAAYGSISSTLIGAALSMIVFLGDDVAASGLTLRSSGVTPRRKGQLSELPDPKKVSRAFDLCNVITGSLNTFLAFPNHTIVAPWKKWTMWSMMAFRTGVGIITCAIPPTTDEWKDGMAIINSLTGSIQYVYQIDVSTEAGGPTSHEARRDAIATCFFAGTLSKTLGTLFAQAEPWGPIAQGFYWVFSVGSVGLQIWNVEENFHGGAPWDPSPTYI